MIRMRSVGATLWIGNALEARDLSAVLAIGIEAIVDLAIDEPPIQPTRDLIYVRIPLIDGAGNSDQSLRLAISTAHQLLTAKVPTMVACSAGMSRSPVIAAAAMQRLSKVTLTEQLNHIARIGPCDVSPLLLNDVRAIIDDHIA